MKSSLLYWYPKIKELELLTPKTEIIELKNQNYLDLISVAEGDFKVLEPQWNEILEKALKIGFPLFMRTDEFSGKHHWKDTCYVEKEKDLKKHIVNLFECSFCADIMGLPLRAIVFREFISMKTLFKAFYGEMPVNVEVRFFINNGKIKCWHWYWIEYAIETGTEKNKLPSDWKNRIKRAKRDYLSENNIAILSTEVNKVAKQFKGYWSVDLCLSKQNKWILIDMAEGHKSWHPECKYKVSQKP